MAGRKIINQDDAKRCLQGVKSSQTSLSQWARAHGVDGRSLHAWQMTLERRGNAKSISLAVPRKVEIIPAASSSRAVRYVLRIADVELEIGADFDEATLRRLVGLLKSC